ncbi:MAG: TRAP transporter small permease [Rhodospirillales bacterium]|jgi:C4-dicarboxylate transporter DctQ subunit|nr:TRAP transporter small permease [Rhodospirillales bacterium]MDP6773269.1 TRAP transporter small permease [Rhodospirillales bacterium]
MMRRLIGLLHRFEEGFLAFLLAAMAIVTFSQVVARYVFNTGAIWALELTTFLFAWLVILGISYGIRVRAHIGVDAFVKLFRAPVQRFLGLLAIAAGLLYAGLMLVGSWEQTFGIIFEFDIESEDLKVPLWMPLSVLVIGFALMITRLLVIAWRVAVLKETDAVLGDEGREAIEQFAESDVPDKAGERAE